MPLLTEITYNRVMFAAPPNASANRVRPVRYASITVPPGMMKTREWKTLSLDADAGKYAITADDERLVLLPNSGGPMVFLNYSGTIRISQADQRSGLFRMTFKDGLVVRGPTSAPFPE
ncbi:MAG TPA: hypothetical protein VN911_06590 [Candidatus Acidoferrum sp.]|nr:hypothetical protein [Candidatus Acidoferrum sp.]